MSIRSEAMPYRAGVSGNLQELLRKNGMTAQIALEGDRFALYVQGHDSPMLRYDITEQQMRALADGGTNYSNKKAYQTFNNIVSKDFDLPSSFVAARNVNSRVAMGLHGYRERVEGYGRGMGFYARPHAFGPGFLGWSPAQQPGFHLRRVGGVAMMANPMVMEHRDGRIRPGELKSGSYGYYYKGGQQQTPARTIDPMEQLKVSFPPIETKPRSTEPAIAYKDVINSPVYFTNEKWQEVLSSHGIVIDDKDRTMTIQSAATEHDIKVNLTNEQYIKLTDNSLKSTSIQARLDIINAVMANDFDGKVTMDMLNSKERIKVPLKPDVAAQLNQLENQRIAEQYHHDEPEVIKDWHVAPTTDPNKGYVDGKALSEMNERKGWFREGQHGREVSVDDIWVEKIPSAQAVRESQMEKDASDHALKTVAANINAMTGEEKFNNDNVNMKSIADALDKLTPEQKNNLDKVYAETYNDKLKELKDNQPKVENKKQDQKTTYRMSAVINGEVITHEISQKQYDRFMAVDDYQRQRMMSKVFKEVDMKTRPEMRERFNLGAFLSAGLTALSEATYLGADIAHNIEHIKHPHHAPEIYSEVHGRDHILAKPGVDSPQDIAQRAYERGFNQATFGGMHR